jgi:hypothetical protein
LRCLYKGGVLLIGRMKLRECTRIGARQLKRNSRTLKEPNFSAIGLRLLRGNDGVHWQALKEAGLRSTGFVILSSIDADCTVCKMYRFATTL